MAKMIFPASGKKWRGMSGKVRVWAREIKDYLRKSPGALSILSAQIAEGFGQNAAVIVGGASTTTVRNSASSKSVTNATPTITNNVLVDVALPATAALITSAQALTGVAPSGTYTSTVTFTVTAGVISAIALS